MSIGELLGGYYTFFFIMVVLLYTIIFNRTMYHRVRKDDAERMRKESPAVLSLVDRLDGELEKVFEEGEEVL